MIDTNAFSLSHATFAWANPKLSRVSRRSVVDVFATIAWFRVLAADADATSIGDMVGHYGPQGTISSDKYKTLHHQWTERSIGRRCPTRATILAAEGLCADSACIFELALWPALRTDWHFDHSRDEVRRRLPANLSKRLDIQLQDNPNRWESSCVRALSDRGTLDDLACLLVLLRRGNAAASSHAAYGLGRAVNRVLLIQAGWLLAHGLLRPLVEYVDVEFFKRAPTSVGPSATEAEYFRMLERLVITVPRHLPEVADGFDADLWARGAHLALSVAN